MTLSGKGPKCRVCTHPDRVQIESLLARGAGIAAVKPTMGDAFSRRALYRHRAKHMTASGLSAARPVPFPYSGSPLKRIKWLQREIEHTAALAGHQGNLGLKLKALHELGRSIWMEERLNRGQQEPLDITDEVAYAEPLRRLQEAHERRRAALEPPPIEPASPEVEEHLERAFRLSSQSYRPSATNDHGGNEPPFGQRGLTVSSIQSH
jgi:hypothetical protein